MSASSAKTPSGIVGPTFGTASRPEPPSRSAVVLSFFAILVMALSLVRPLPICSKPRRA